MHHKSKHINATVRVYRLREFVSDGTMELCQAASADHTAEALTKSVSAELLRWHRQRMPCYLERSRPDPSTNTTRSGNMAMILRMDDGRDCNRVDLEVAERSLSRHSFMTWLKIIMISSHHHEMCHDDAHLIIMTHVCRRVDSDELVKIILNTGAGLVYSG
eukprot:3226490-Rhodomonas_salina.1